MTESSKAKVVTPVIFGKAQTMSDKSVKIEFQTRELDPLTMASLFNFATQEAEGWLLFSPNQDLEEADIPDEHANAEYKGKTPAQRLRAVMYKMWEAKGSKGDFETHYRAAMEKLINQFKEQLQ